MVYDLQITCITRNGYPYDCTCITAVGVGTVFFTVNEVINSINNKTAIFYVLDQKDGSKAYVVPFQRGNNWHIRTKPNDTSDDNLLKLPDCVKPK